MDAPVSLLIALIVQLLSQIVKVVGRSVRERRLVLEPFTQSGGMPSAHTAFVTALSLSVGIRAGFGSEAFSVALVLAAVVIHDALRVRGTLQEVIAIIKRIDQSEQTRHLPETIGHSPAEVAAGVIFALVCGLPLALWWP